MAAPPLHLLRFHAFAFLLGILLSGLPAAGADARPSSAAIPEPIDFNRQIRPILHQHCTGCHGGVKAAGGVSFVYRDVLTTPARQSGRPVVTPGDPDRSELIARITSPRNDYRMPPADHAPALPPGKIALLREWIRQGASWQEHWAFLPPQPAPVPALPPALQRAARQPLDHFVLARLERERLTAAPEAERAALLRRVSLDLTGLPPTPEEIAAFVRDRSPDAYERQVDRLLGSPHFGERWASHWLDLARYADTKGYEKDDHRDLWPYRDWVVEAFNRNLPYDRFITEQMAGDLLPEATITQRIATAFHRNTQVNDEGGTDDEEYRTSAVIDRVATTWQVTSAVTFGCVQCHAHPYDPIRHEDYYRFFAFFNDTRDADFRDEYPTLRVPRDRARRDEAWRLRGEIERLRGEVIAAGRALEADRGQWSPLPIATATAKPEANLSVRDGMLIAEGTVAAAARFELSAAVRSDGAAPITAIRFEVPPEDPEVARHTPERGFIVTQLSLALRGADGEARPVAVGRFFPDTHSLETVTTRRIPAPGVKAAPGGNVAAAKTKSGAKATPRATAIASAPAAPAAPVAPADPGEGPGEQTPPPVARKAAPVVPEETRDATLDFHFAANPTLHRPRWVVAALREPLALPEGAELHVSVSHGRQITEKPAPVRRLRLAAGTDPRWTELARDPDLARKAARAVEAVAALAKIPGVDLPVLEQLPPGETRETRLFVRGNFMEKTGAPLAPGVPALFPALSAADPANRLTLARWFFQPGQPLTARVAVNRFWEQLFGTGLVATVEDFGSVGEAPSHPELLDWLAVRFERELRWDVKALLRELVTSATYRQDARTTPALLERDPQNRLLARGPRQRLTAEMVRDQALAAAGLLSRKMGGEPVMPPQPSGIWQTVYNRRDWVESTGEDRYRRALYTYWKRSAPYPGFLTFDLPPRDLCTVRRTPTNTPLQALVTLNDVVYHEAAAALAARAVDEARPDGGVEAQIARAYELVISRPPTAGEAVRLRRLYDELARDPERRAAALSGVAAAILNLDAAFVR